MGGMLGLAGAIVLGPRIGKFKDGKAQPIPGHHIPMVVVGTFILAFGWFGFNPGSTLAGTDLRISAVVVNTMLASVAGGLGAHIVLSLKGLKPDPSMLCNGLLSGLVAITAPCAFVDSWAAFVIGLISGVICVLGVFFWERMRVDDVVGAVTVHGMNGIWGVISVGIFASGKYGAGWNGVERFVALGSDEAKQKQWKDTYTYGYDGVRGALYGDMGQLWAQLLNAGVVIAFGLIVGFAFFKISNLITPMRVSKETELAGLDSTEMGAHAYPDFTITN